ncbi:hypothetical protein Trydic_g22339 [Trypoxylus dichotomus]
MNTHHNLSEADHLESDRTQQSVGEIFGKLEILNEDKGKVNQHQETIDIHRNRYEEIMHRIQPSFEMNLLLLLED